MSVAARMIERALTNGLLQGTLCYAGQYYACSHSPINTQLLLSPDGGGFSPLTTVTIILQSGPDTGFSMNTPAQLVAADGETYWLRLATNEAAGNGLFTQLTAHHVNQGV